MKALIIDDDSGFTGLLGQMLPYSDYDDVVIAKNGREALPHLAAKPPPALLLCDLRMPQMDGMELITHLVRLEFRGALIFLSGERREQLQAAETLARSQGLRVLGALQKPFALADLDALLAKDGP